jgi:hypothetical protein
MGMYQLLARAAAAKQRACEVKWRLKWFLIHEGTGGTANEVLEEVGGTYPELEAALRGWLDYCASNGGFDEVAKRSKGVRLVWTRGA